MTSTICVSLNFHDDRQACIASLCSLKFRLYCLLILSLNSFELGGLFALVVFVRLGVYRPAMRVCFRGKDCTSSAEVECTRF